MILRIGLTGGIGSGKSLVATLFSLLRIPVYHADDESKRLLDGNPVLQEKLVAAFGKKIYNSGKIDRKFFAELIFKDQKSVALANSIIHPFVFEDFQHWVYTHDTGKYILMEAAILYESHAESMLDKVIVVYSDEETRIQRVKARDHYERDFVLQRMRYQLPDEEKAKRADYVLYNDDKRLLIPQVLELHEKLSCLKLSAIE